MPQTRPNHGVVPINADAYNLAPDLATLTDSLNVVIPVASQTERDALTKTDGMIVVRKDVAGRPLELWDGTVWWRRFDDTGWITTGLVFGNGFTSYTGSGYDGIKYRKVDNAMHVSGAAANAGTWSGGVAICALPAGFIPTRKIVGMNCVIDTSGNVLVTPSGTNTTVTVFAQFYLG